MTANKSQIDIDIIDPIIENDLQGYELDEGEYAPKTVSRIEALIYEWLCGRTIMDSLWFIRDLSEYLHRALFDMDIELGPVVYMSEEAFDEEDSDEE